MVSVRHPLSTFKNLILPYTPISVYLSYAISKTRNSPKDIKQINQFREKMHELGKKHDVTIFDPVTIDELILKQASKQKGSTVTLNKSLRWPLNYANILVEENNSVVKLTKTEIKNSMDYIKHQVKSRDLKLVEQAALLVVYRPFFNGPSTGAKAEIDHAKDKGNDMCIYSPTIDKIPSSDNPFDNIITPIRSKEKFYQKIEEKLIALKKANNKSTNSGGSGN